MAEAKVEHEPGADAADPKDGAVPTGDAPPPQAPLDLPAGRSRRAIIFFIVTMVLTLAIDLVVKTQSFKHVAGEPVVLSFETASDTSFDPIPPHPPIVVLGKVLALKLTVNRGAVFGIGQGKRWVFVVVSLIAIAVIGRVFYKSAATAKWTHLCLGLILAGALGNLYDRLVFGAVRDMFWLFPGVSLPFGWHWPNGSDQLYPWIFNIANVALVVGVLLLVVIMWRADMRAAKLERESREAEEASAK